MSNYAIEAYHVEEALPNKMTSKDKIPKKTTDKGKSTHKFNKKNRKSPPETIARKRNMDSDHGSEFEDDDPNRDKVSKKLKMAVLEGRDLTSRTSSRKKRTSSLRRRRRKTEKFKQLMTKMLACTPSKGIKIGQRLTKASSLKSKHTCTIVPSPRKVCESQS